MYTESNKLIAKFDEKSFYDASDKNWNGSHRNFEVSQLKYHESWDWLMPVFEKIFKLSTPEDDESNEVTEYYFRTFGMMDNKDVFMVRINGFPLHRGESLIEAAYNAVLEFIEWYNLQKK